MIVHPQTPQSPSQLSPNATEPSTMNSSMASTATTLPTPAHSVNGSSSSMGHEPFQDVSMLDDSPQKRKRALEDVGDRDQKKAHIEERRLGIQVLHQNVGEKYLLCKTPHQRSAPPVSEDLFEAFNLTDIAASVARTLPNGEKNSIRKTYKGHMKKLGIAGHFDASKRELDDEDGFMRLIYEPEDSWYVRQVKNKEIGVGLLDEVQSHLRAATAMNKGPIEKSIWDQAVLGEMSSEKLSGAKGGMSSAKGTAPNTPLHPGLSRPKTTVAAAAQQVPVQDAARPRRSIKKRSYGDSSFEGYGEGFPDDEMGLDTGYSTGEGEDRGASHKRRKKNPGPSQFSAPVRQQSYGPGMVGA